MDDLFYFTRRDVALSEIANVARRLDCQAVNLGQRGLELVLDDGSRTDWSVFDFDKLENADRDDLLREGIRSAFCVSHHPVAIRTLLGLLRVLLAEFGGWIGNDDDRFMPRFDLSNLDKFRYS